ncbi:MAG TPA: MFS transporter [Xanthomonadales bacterium]|nr:MFS transporter [Xanthomonadales bacterium]
MIRALTPVAPLLLGVAILLTGQGLQSTLLPVRANMESFSTVAIGLMGGAYFLGFTLGCLRGVQLVQKLGHVRVFAAMAALASAAPLLHALWLDTWAWWVLRLTSGFCFAVLYVVIESWINEQSSNENRGTVFSAYVFISMTVLAAGQQMILLYDPQDMALFAIASVLVSIAALPVVMSTSETPRHAEALRLDLRRLYRISHTGMLACFAAGLTNGAFWSLAPVFTAGVSDKVALAAGFMTGAVIGGAAGQWPLGYWSDRVDRRIVVAVVAVASAAVGIVLWLSYGSLSMMQLILLSALWGGLAFPMYSVAVAHTNDFAQSGEYVMVSGGLLLMYGLGAIVGPFLAAGAMTLLTESVLYLFTAVIHLLVFVYVLVRLTRRPSAPMAEHVPFAEALTAVQTASQAFEEDR